MPCRLLPVCERTVVVIFKPFRIFRTFRKWLPAICLLILPAGVWAADFIPVSEISRGMKGYGLTVFQGARIDTFGVEVVGIQERSRVDGNLILVEVSGHDLARSNIAQGMSGSPIYIEGRFAGALAFGWAGALRPLAGVTPARDILGLPVEPEVLHQPVQTSSLGGVQDMLPLLVNSAKGQELAFQISGGTWSPENLDIQDKSWPAADVLILDLLQEAASSAGVGLPQAEHWYCSPAGAVSGSSGAATAKSGTLVPGAACAVPLVTGDAMLGVTGTVTWTNEDDVLMMGHPFMQRGPVNLPLATAEILTGFPSRQMSFKMATVGDIVGSVHHDQRAGLAGKLGPAPRMIPVTVEVAFSDSQIRQYEFEVVDDPLMTPSLVFWTLYNSLLAEGDDASNQNISYEVKSNWQGFDLLSNAPLVISGVASGPGGAMSLASDWMAPFSLLLSNPFQKVKLESVQARFEVSSSLNTARITGLDGPRNPAAGSDFLTVQVEITPRMGMKQMVQVDLPLPANLQPGPYRLVAASEAEFFALEAQRAAGRFQVASLDGAVKILSMQRAADHLVVALLSPGKGLMIADREMKHLPGSVSRLLQQGNMQIQSTMADFIARDSQPMPFALQGHAVRKLRVRPAPAPIKEERRP